MNATDTPKARSIATPGEGTIASRVAAGLGLRPSPFDDRHFSRLAIIFVRQSDPHQVLNHIESRERQYALVDLAAALGWPRDRILLIDEDQGKSGKTADWRTGFHRLLAEVTMDHVGLILGIEMSRMARNNKDWHHLMEMCAIFGTLLADEDRIYDPRDPEDRLVLGFKGNISEYELILMHNRLERNRLHKAKRCALFLDVPCGYVKLPTGEVARDPDEQVQSIVQLVFDKFDELGSCKRLYRHLVRNKIHLGMRHHQGPRRGQLEWRLPSRDTLYRMLHHPIYAGAYSYGRRRVDHKRTAASGGKVKMREVPMSEWIVLQRDRLPAYITWERYEANQQRLLQNSPRPSSPGVPRNGKALLTSLLVCGACGRRMYATYRSKSTAYYLCTRMKNEGSTCCGLEAGVMDDLVSQLVLRAIEPATLELSLKAIRDVHQERERLHRHWKHRLERATYEAERAQRQYQAVEPENRLVARTLERQWEESLRNQRNLSEEYDRFVKEQPPHLSEGQRARILALSNDLPTLWNAPETTAADRKEIIRLVVERVVVHVHAGTECGEVVISWRGGATTRNEIVRTVARYESLGRYGQMIDRIIEMRQQGQTIKHIAAQLNAEGYRTPRSRRGYTSTSVRKLLSRGELTRGRIATRLLDRNEWWLPDLARELQMSANKLRDWALRGWIRSRQVPPRGLWVVWADGRERQRLRKLREASTGKCAANTGSPREQVIHR
jgi:DNA invertase Pin-like site-specific DNA recombinase